MAIEGNLETIPGLTTAVDMSTTGQYRFAVLDSAFTVSTADAATECPCGVVQNNPKSGLEASVAFKGVTKVYLGGTVAAGDRVATDTNGAAVKVTEGTDTTTYIMGQMLEDGSSGDLRSLLLAGTPHRAA